MALSWSGDVAFLSYILPFQRTAHCSYRDHTQPHHTRAVSKKGNLAQQPTYVYGLRLVDYRTKNLLHLSHVRHMQVTCMSHAAHYAVHACC